MDFISKSGIYKKKYFRIDRGGLTSDDRKIIVRYNKNLANQEELKRYKRDMEKSILIRMGKKKRLKYLKKKTTLYFNARNSTKSMIGGKDSGVIPLSQKPPHYTKTYPTFMPPVYDWWFLTTNHICSKCFRFVKSLIESNNSYVCSGCRIKKD